MDQDIDIVPFERRTSGSALTYVKKIVRLKNEMTRHLRTSGERIRHFIRILLATLRLKVRKTTTRYCGCVTRV